MNKLLKNRLFTYATTFLIVFVFLSSTSLSSVSAATIKETQSEFLNYMAYDAVLLKKIEKTSLKIEKLKQDEKYVSNLKKHYTELKSVLKKMNDISSKNKEIQALHKVQLSWVKDYVAFYGYIFKAMDTGDINLINNIDKKSKEIIDKIDKKAKVYEKLARNIMNKYNIKTNENINYVAFSGSGSKVSSESFTYIVKKGDDLSTIAQTYKVTVSSIKKWNRLKSNYLLINQKLKIYVK